MKIAIVIFATNKGNHVSGTAGPVLLTFSLPPSVTVFLYFWCTLTPPTDLSLLIS